RSGWSVYCTQCERCETTYGNFRYIVFRTAKALTGRSFLLLDRFVERNMHRSNIRRQFALALCLSLCGTGLAGTIQPALAGFSIPDSVKAKLKPLTPHNPFKKKKDDAPPQTPPGMRDKEDDKDLDPVEKEANKQDQDEKERQEAGAKAAREREDRAADAYDADPELPYRIAKQEIERKNYKDALIQINKALTLNHNFWEARYLGAYVFQLQGRTKEAIVKYKEYLAMRPEDQQARINLGICLHKEGKFDEAEYEYKKAINIHYFSLQAHYNLANLLIERDQLEPALKELLACEKIAPTNAGVHNNLGVIYQKRDYYEEAEAEFRRAANLDPANKAYEQNLVAVQETLRHRPLHAVAGKLQNTH
ncbi:MAG: tetratricopeptide repeat protein, partial [Terriglobales bacterium]